MNQSEIRDHIFEILHRIAPEADLNQLDPAQSLRESLDIDSFDFLKRPYRFTRKVWCRDSGIRLPSGFNAEWNDRLSGKTRPQALSIFYDAMSAAYMFFPETRNAVASIMCGFAIALAFILTLKIVPAYDRAHTTH